MCRAVKVCKQGCGPPDRTSAPADRTSASADRTSAPEDHTSAPADHTSAPADHTSAPADRTSAPASAANRGAAEEVRMEMLLPFGRICRHSLLLRPGLHLVAFRRAGEGGLSEDAVSRGRAEYRLEDACHTWDVRNTDLRTPAIHGRCGMPT